jgi:hypothetical protein
VIPAGGLTGLLPALQALMEDRPVVPAGLTGLSPALEAIRSRSSVGVSKAGAAKKQSPAKLPRAKIKS